MSSHSLNPRIKGIHPLALFGPKMAPLHFVELREHMRSHGLLSPILIDSDGMIVDGQNRWLAACEIPVFVIPDDKIEVTTKKGDELRAELLGRNLYRRHLTDAQRTQMAADYAIASRKTAWPKTLEEVARESETYPRSVSDASNLRQKAPALADSVLAGELSPHAAKQAIHLDPELQQMVIDDARQAKALAQQQSSKRSSVVEGHAQGRNWKASKLRAQGKGDRIERLLGFIVCLKNLPAEFGDLAELIAAGVATTIRLSVLKADLDGIKPAAERLIAAIESRSRGAAARNEATEQPTALN